MAFDKAKYLIKVQGGREYLPVAARLVWFREEHPDWGVVTSAVEINLEKQYAIFTATIMNADGKIMATATKMENVRGFGDYLEKAECVPLSTRILTLEGWKTHDELRLGETVAAYNAQTDALEWVPLLAVRTYENVPVVRMSNRKGFDVVCTPDHKWAARYSVVFNKKRYEYRQLRQTTDLSKACAITTAAVAPAPAEATLPVTPQQAFVMGMLITDGSVRYSGKQVRGYICQSKPEVVAVLRERLAHVPHREEVIPAYTRTFPTGKTYDCQVGYRWHLAASYLHDLHDAFGIVHETELPQVAGRLSPDARAALLEAMTLAESDKRGNFAQMPGRNDWVIDLWTYLCALEGSQVCRSVVRESCGGIWTARRKKTRQVWASNVKIEDAGTLDVWCPQTPLGTWVARFDNDVVTVTGNTGAVGRALAYCGYGTQFAPELEEGSGRTADAPFGGTNRFPAGGGPNGNGNRFSSGNVPAPARSVERPMPPPQAARPATPVNREPVPQPAPVADDEDDFDPNFDDDEAPAAPPQAAANRVAERPAASPMNAPRPAARPAAPSDEDEDPFADLSEPAPARPSVAPPVRAAAARAAAASVQNESGEAVLTTNRCSEEGCPVTLTSSQLNLSVAKFGRALCPRHQKDATPTVGGPGKRPGQPAESLL